MAKIGFIGLGNMGGPMAANLVKAGHEVSGFDLSKDSLKLAADNGVEVCQSPIEAARAQDVVITMLPAGQHVLSVYDQILSEADKGTLMIDCSTIDVESAKQAHKHAQDYDMLSIDAPVSGGVGGAQAGTLTFMAGGTSEAFEKAEEILEPMAGRKAAKICNNMILGISMIGVCEAFALGEKLGLSHQALFDVASNSSGQCWSLTTYCPVPGPVATSPANNEYRPGFAVDLMLKDLRLAQEAAQKVSAQTHLGAHAAQIYGLLSDLGEGGKDFSAVIEMLRKSEKA